MKRYTTTSKHTHTQLIINLDARIDLQPNPQPLSQSPATICRAPSSLQQQCVEPLVQIPATFVEPQPLSPSVATICRARTSLTDDSKHLLSRNHYYSLFQPFLSHKYYNSLQQALVESQPLSESQQQFVEPVAQSLATVVESQPPSQSPAISYRVTTIMKVSIKHLLRHNYHNSLQQPLSSHNPALS
ncbi:unnamed protein product [Mytilus coruscus]|uniref:Uncharacterized protein n=1 Tax=Mytilus coruscus TaxID=42192 RepID=A0A6J8AJR7_MYTCO|nr:unnamed protein product [Mytilus coruscus]